MVQLDEGDLNPYLERVEFIEFDIFYKNQDKGHDSGPTSPVCMFRRER